MLRQWNINYKEYAFVVCWMWVMFSFCFFCSYGYFTQRADNYRTIIFLHEIVVWESQWNPQLPTVQFFFSRKRGMHCLLNSYIYNKNVLEKYSMHFFKNFPPSCVYLRDNISRCYRFCYGCCYCCYCCGCFFNLLANSKWTSPVITAWLVKRLIAIICCFLKFSLWKLKSQK